MGSCTAPAAAAAAAYGILLALCWDRQTDKSWIVEVAIYESEVSTLGPPSDQTLVKSGLANVSTWETGNYSVPQESGELLAVR